MPRRGPAPSDPSRRRRTNSPDEWVDVPNVPYTGKPPALPRARKDLVKNQLMEVPVSEMTPAVVEGPHLHAPLRPVGVR